MSTVITNDGVGIFYKDWGRRTHSPSSSTTAGRCHPTTGMPRCFLPFQSYRVVAHDRRGHGPFRPGR